MMNSGSLITDDLLGRLLAEDFKCTFELIHQEHAPERLDAISRVQTTSRLLGQE